jgi:hypothetical protein
MRSQTILTAAALLGAGTFLGWLRTEAQERPARTTPFVHVNPAVAA